MTTQTRRPARIAIGVSIVLVTMAAAILSLVPALPDALLTLHFMLHPLSYAAMTFLYLIGAVWDPWTGSRRWPNGAPVVIGIVVGVGLLLEAGQLFTSRGAELGDVVGNLVGVAIGSIGWGILRRTAGIPG